MHRLKQIFYVWVALLLYPLHASVVVPGDVPYSSVEQGQTLYIFSDNTREFINQLAAYNEAIRRRYDKSYSWRLDQRMDLILTSPRQQVANAYATIIPNVKTVWYPSGAAMLEEMAESSWLLTLAAHETAHLYQINAKGEVPAALTKVLGNSVTFVPFIWPVFLHPNLFTPTFLVEGNAVLMESRLNMGGRLHSGEKRALVLAQIQAGLINSNRLLNDDFRFPFGEESYLQGGYFQAHLAAKHGVDKTNAFFVKQGERWLWPLILNNTFREHFGASYAQEIREYVRGLEPLALKQQRSAGTSLLQTTYTSPLNHDAEKIFFLATKGKAPPVLHVFNKAAKQFDRQEQLDLFLGKVFFIDGKPHTSAAHQHDLHHIEYSLYAPGARFNPGFRSQIVTDRRGGKTAALDPANSWLENRVLVNGENFDISHSSPILDDAGRVYYFRQNGSERILYRDREPVFKYDGFYGKALEVTSDGSFHFIANTDYGSSFFRLKDGEVTRLLASDRIVDARAWNENE